MLLLSWGNFIDLVGEVSETMTKRTLNMLFGLGLAGLVQLLDPAPSAAQERARPQTAQTTQATQDGENSDDPHEVAIRARRLRESLQTLLSNEQTGTIVPGAVGNPNYSGLFQVSDIQNDQICLMQRGNQSGGTETFRGRESSPFESNSTFINLYKEFTTVGHLTGNPEVDVQIQDAVRNLHTRVWNTMYAGGAQLTQPSDWELTWQDGELMGIQVARERLIPLREAARRYARTLPQDDDRRDAILRGRIFSRGRHSYWTNGPLPVCLMQEYLVPRNPVREVIQIVEREVPVVQEPESRPAPASCIDEVLDTLLRLERGQGLIRDELRDHDQRVLERLDALGQRIAEFESNHEQPSGDDTLAVGGFAHQWIVLDETNAGGTYSYRADGSGGSVRIHFNGNNVTFALAGGVYAGSATIDGVAHDTPFHGEASGLDVVSHANLVYTPWRVSDDLRLGLGAEIAFDVRDLHDIVYQIAGEEVRDQNITAIHGALAPGVMLAYRGDAATVEAFLGLGPALEHRTDSDETQGSGFFVGRLLTSFQAGYYFLPYLQANGAVDFRDGQLRTRAGAEAGILVQFGDFVIGPAGSIEYRHTEGNGFSRDSMDYQVYLHTGFRTGGRDEDQSENR